MVAHEHAALAIDGNAPSTLDVTGADGAHVLAVTAAEHLNSMVVLVRHNQVPAAVECNTQTIIQRAVTFTCTADAAEVPAAAVLKNLNGMIVTVGDKQFALGVKREITPRSKLPRTFALAPNAAHMRAITQPEHLQAA